MANSLIGRIKEKIGRTYHKVLAVRIASQGFVEEQRRFFVLDNPFEDTERLPVELPYTLDSLGVPEGYHIEVRTVKVLTKKPILVASYFFNEDETFWDYDETHRFFIHPMYEALGQSEGHVQVVDFDTGNHLFFGGEWVMDPLCSPATVSAVQDVRDWKAFIAGATVGNPWLMFGLGLIVGVFATYLVMSNATLIMHLLNHSSSPSSSSTTTVKFILAFSRIFGR